MAELHANADAKANKADSEAREAEQAAQVYSYAQRAEFIERTKGDLEAIRQDLERLTTKVEELNGQAKADAKKELARVQAKWTQTKQQLDRAESATESTWNEVQSGFKKSFGDLKESVDTMRQWLSDKIAP